MICANSGRATGAHSSTESRIRRTVLKRSKLFAINRCSLSVMSVFAALAGLASHGRHNPRPPAQWAAEKA